MGELTHRRPPCGVGILIVSVFSTILSSSDSIDDQIILSSILQWTHI